MSKCSICGDEINMYSGACRCDGSALQAPEKMQEDERNGQLLIEEELAILAQNLSKIALSTGTVQQAFKVIDIVFAMDSHEQGFFANMIEKTTGIRRDIANPSKAFDKVKLQLKHQCREMGGDAVINCQFEHRAAVGSALPGLSAIHQVVPGIGGGKQRIEIFAYGTVVKLITS